MAIPTFQKLFFSNQSKSRRQVGTHMKNTGPKIGHSIWDFEDQAWTQLEENMTFDLLISENPLL